MLIGLVGKTNVGKSTFFKAATLAEVEISNRPFVTIKPNHGIGFVKVKCQEEHFGKNCNPRTGFCINKNRFVPVELLDVAGLVPGAHEGRGLGNQFLDDLRQADLLIHVVDMSGTTDSEGKPCDPGTHDPCKDISFLEEELDFWYLEILKKIWKSFSRKIEIEHGDFIKHVAKQFSGLKINEEIVKKVVRSLSIDLEKESPSNWNDLKLLEFARELRKQSKPIIIAANKADKSGFDENFKRAKELFPHLLIIPCSAEAELALREANRSELIKYLPGESDFKILKELDSKREEALEFIKERVIKKYGSTGVQEILNKAVFEFLNYVYVFPVENSRGTDSQGNLLPDCFLMPPNSTALDLAYRIHTDIGRNFIKAIEIKERIPVGKDYILKNGDVIEIMTKK